MCRKVSNILSLVGMLLLLLCPGWALAKEQAHEDAMSNVASFLKWNGNIHVKINGKEQPLTPSASMENSRILIPFKQIFTTLGANVISNGEEFTAVTGQKTIIVKAGETRALINGNEVELDHENVKVKK